MRSFLFLIADRLLRDNRGVVIMQDSSFLIRGARITETGCFSLLHEFLGRLYCLITWQGAFSSKPRPVYFGMGRISLWVDLPGWVYAPTPFIRWRFGLALWACALGLCTYCFLLYQLYYMHIISITTFISMSIYKHTYINIHQQ